MTRFFVWLLVITAGLGLLANILGAVLGLVTSLITGCIGLLVLIILWKVLIRSLNAEGSGSKRYSP